MNSAPTQGISQSAAALIKGLFSAIIIISIGAAITALLFNLTDVSSNILNLSHYLILGLAFLISGFITGRSCKNKSLLHGLLLALLSIVIILIATAAGSNIYLLNAIVKSIIIIFCSSLGGMLGVH